MNDFIYYALFAAMGLMFNSGPASGIYACDFETDKCDFTDDFTVSERWIRQTGPTPTRNTGPSGDHTTETGYYMYAESSDTENGDMARMYSEAIVGSKDTCTTIQFYYHMYGSNLGFLKMYILGNEPYYFTTPVWEREAQSEDAWKKAELTVSLSFDYKIAFEATFGRPGITDTQGDIAIDDISITTFGCSFTSCQDNGFFCLNGGTCVEGGDVTGAGFEYTCECPDGWSGTHCENDYDECAVTNCGNGICLHGLNQYECSCDLGYYGDHCEFVDMCLGNEVTRCLNGGTCNRVGNDFNCTCAPGYTGDICDIDINECAVNPCKNGGQCVDAVNQYTCSCSADYYGVHCQSLAGSCDFEDGSIDACGYKNEFYWVEWIANQGRTPVPSIGPTNDHTTGAGYYVYAEVENFEDDAIDRTARIVSPTLPATSVAACTIVSFWYFMNGDDVGTLSLFTRSESNTIESVPIWTESGNQGNEWKLGTVEISYPVQYSIVFDSISTRLLLPIQNNYIALDDILVEPNTCIYKRCSSSPCKNGGLCFEESDGYRCECKGTWTGTTCEEDRNECQEGNPCLFGGTCTDKNPGFTCACMPDYVGSQCEYLKGSCDFDDMKSQQCGYTIDPTGDFTWETNRGPTPSDLTGPSVDHTFGTDEGYYLYAETSNKEGGDQARIITPEVPGSGATCIELDFWYHMFGPDLGELAVYVKFDNEVLTTPIWNIIGSRNISENKWKHAQLNISVPSSFSLVFEVTTLPQSIFEPDNRGDIAIDDIVVGFESNCNYDDCFLNPCLNDGICITVNDGYKCDCKPGYDGKHCDNVPSCTPNPCQNGGTCLLDEDGEEVCLCKQEFTGDHCELNDRCYPNPCENGGICTSYDTTFTCDCPAGFVGTTCETNVNECSSSPCVNGGVCIDLVNEFRCDCKGDYIGTRCEKVEGGCDFETGFCDWTKEEGHLPWDLNSGPSPSWPASGPRADHTKGDDTGYYAFTAVYADQPGAGAKYRLKSPTFSPSIIESGKVLTLDFYYHMYGPGIGSLNVYYTDTRGGNNLWRITKEDDKTEWQNFRQSVTPQADFSFTIEHETIRSPLYLADLAIDDISLMIEGGSSVVDTTTTVPSTTTISSTTTAPTTTTTGSSTDKHTDPPIVVTTAATQTTKSTGTKTTTNFTPKTTTGLDKDGDEEGLSGGAIAGIVIGVLAGAFLITGALYYYRKRKTYSDIPNGMANVAYSGGEDVTI